MENKSIHFTDKPLAAKGLISYRYKGNFGWIMIGAYNHDDAMNQAKRNICSAHKLTKDNLQIWNGIDKYIPVFN